MEAESISFSCIVSGQPTPNVTWLKDGQPLLKDPMDYIVYNSPVTFSGGSDLEKALNSTLFLSRLMREDSGVYTCRGENKLGQAEMDEGYALTVETSGMIRSTTTIIIIMTLYCHYFVDENMDPVTEGLREEKIVNYASYSASVLCILPLIAVGTTHLITK